ncbi:MAG: UDP-3-O-(3-hydroxymyristoyl)glucosamine N-acyltransferase [Acidobacteriaceae bacterium]
MKLRDLAAQLGSSLHGDGEVEITGVAGIEEAVAGQITFVSNPRYAAAAKTTRASAVLVAPEFPEIAVPTLRLANPYLAFAQAIALLHPSPVYPPGIHPTAVIDPTAVIGESAHIGAYVVVGAGVRLGAGAVLLPHAVIYHGVTAGRYLFAHAHAVVREHCMLGDRVILQNGVVVGGDGFGFAKRDDGSWQKIPQSGPVCIGSDVEIQANACIDRASVGATTIADGAKIDNLVQVGHGSRVGENTLLCAQVGLAGSTEVGRDVVLAGQVGVAGHCKIGDGVIATAQSGIPNDVAAGKVVSGYPAIDNRQWLRASAVFQRLPELLRRLPKRTSLEISKKEDDARK